MKIKNLFLITLTFFVLTQFVSVSCKTDSKKMPAKQVIIAGNITNPTGDSVWIRLNPPIGRDMAIFGSELDQKHEFQIRFEMDKGQSATFYDGTEVAYMFIQPGDSIYITLDTEQFDETIEYSGIGANENNYLAAKFLKFDDARFNLWNFVDSVTANQYVHYLDSVKSERNAFLNEYIQEYPGSKDFMSYEKTNIDFDYAGNLRLYIVKKFNINRELDTISISAEYYATYEDFLNYMNPSVQSSKYNYYLSGYLSYLQMKNYLLFKEVTDRDSVTIDLIIKNFTGYAKEKILSSDFYSKLSRFNIEFFEKYKDVFDEQVKNEEFKEIVYNKYENTKELLAKPMPEGAVLKDLNDSINIDLSFEKIINNYKGKVIYVDFWASWCGPCIAEMPNSLKLQEKFKGQDIAFIYISVDNDPVGWKQFIKVLQIKGDHYRVNKVVKEEINELFNVRYIPRYILIDKDGKVVDDKAKRPGNKEVVKDMEILL